MFEFSLAAIIASFVLVVLAEMGDKKGKLKVTVELEVNEELMEVVKDAMSKASTRIPEMMRRGGENKQ